MSEETKPQSPAVYRAIAAVMAEMAKEGISKDKRNSQQGYNFRGIDDVYNALAPVMSKHGLMMLPAVKGRECVERVNHKGTALFYTTVEVEFTIVSSEDGSKHYLTTYGEAMDSGDKSTNKAMSAAFKYAAMQAFCIPTEGDNDADATTHEVVAKGSKTDKSAPSLKDRLEGALQAVANEKTTEGVQKLYERTAGLRSELDKAGHKVDRIRLEQALTDRVSELESNDPFGGGK